MSTLNHDTELEEILEGYKAWLVGSSTNEKKWLTKTEAIAALHTYLYKQTLELIDDVNKVASMNEWPGIVWIDQDELRKAAERWGQE